MLENFGTAILAKLRCSAAVKTLGATEKFYHSRSGIVIRFTKKRTE
jgi:hypothetical protein